MSSDPPKLPGKLKSLRKTMKIAERNPPLGYTQGGSSRKDSGAKVAGRDAKFRKQPLKGIKLWSGEN